MTILVVDDHPIFRESVITFLKGEEFCSAVVEAGSAEEARDLFAAAPPDLVVCDLTLPGESGLDFLGWVGREHPSCHRVCLTMHAELEVLRQVLATGVRAFVTKSSGYDELVRAIRDAAKQRYCLDQVMMEELIHDFARPPRSAPAGAPGSPGTHPPGVPELEELTQREQEVFDALLRDETLAEISGTLNISIKTVENHRSGIYRKLGIHDRHSLFRLARKLHLLD